MKIELKKIKVHASLSRETNAYTAEVWVNGVKRGSVENHGTGGCDNIYPSELAKELAEHTAALPKDEDGFSPDIDLIFAKIVDSDILTKKLSRTLKSKTVLVKDNKLYTCKGRPGIKQLEGYVVLNDLPFEKAFEIFEKCVGG
jgi:hypothetical protein